MLESLKEIYGDQIRLIYRHNPLSSIHLNAILAAEASEAAGQQGGQDAFWAYHDHLYEGQEAWADTSRAEAINIFVGYAEEIGLDGEQLRTDLEDGTYNQLVLDDEGHARTEGINATPSLFLNGYAFPLEEIPLSGQGIDLVLDIIKLLDRQYDIPPTVIDLTKSYEATIVTDKGDIVLKLFADTAPVNVNSFVFLAQQGWYDETSFHRVLEGFMAQGGDPSGTGVGWPGYRCDNEIVAERTLNSAGVVSLANSGPNTNGGQFFITYGPTPHLNSDFTIIGEVLSGQEVVEALTLRNPDERPAFKGDRIITINIEEK